MNIREVIKKYLEEKEFDGLYGCECGCAVDDLMPCGELNNLSECEPGYKSPASPESEFDFMIGPHKTEEATPYST